MKILQVALAMGWISVFGFLWLPFFSAVAREEAGLTIWSFIFSVVVTIVLSVSLYQRR